MISEAGVKARTGGGTESMLTLYQMHSAGGAERLLLFLAFPGLISALFRQVDRFKLKNKLLLAAVAGGCEFRCGKVAGLQHGPDLSAALLRGGEQV